MQLPGTGSCCRAQACKRVVHTQHNCLVCLGGGIITLRQVTPPHQHGAAAERPERSGRQQPPPVIGDPHRICISDTCQSVRRAAQAQQLPPR
eukprot:363231-Chlamydomonas_euryale.AAC.1